jgi:hypothetical protein
MVSMNDIADRPPRALADGELLTLGRHTIRWFDTPHVPHGWDCGLMVDVETKTFFCGDLFTQPGRGELALTQNDILGPSEAFRQPMDYFAHAPLTHATLTRLAAEAPTRLPACTAALGRATAQRFCGISQRPCRHGCEGKSGDEALAERVPATFHTGKGRDEHRSVQDGDESAGGRNHSHHR